MLRLMKHLDPRRKHYSVEELDVVGVAILLLENNQPVAIAPKLRQTLIGFRVS